MTLKEIKSNEELDIVIRVVYIYTPHSYVTPIGHVAIFYE